MKVCVDCQADVEGKRAMPVREDRIIKGIRSIKKAIGIAQMNQLFVCDGCMAKHMDRRRSFEKTMLFASVFAGLMLVIIILAPLLSGRADVWAIVSGVVVSLFILALPIFKYTPAVEGMSVSASLFGPRKEAQAQQAPPGPSPMPTPPPPPPAGISPQPKKTQPKQKKAKSKK